MAFQPVRGISADHVTNIPEQWSKQWFRGFIRNHLEQMDVRNAVPGPGITITTAAAKDSHTLLARGKISAGGAGGVPLSTLAPQAPFTFVANNTAASAPPTEVNGAGATSMLNLFSPSLKGLVPASGGGTVNFLRADGSFATAVQSVTLADGSTAPIFTITGSPVTGAGTLTETLVTQAANAVFAGPTTGAAAQPTFRALVAADIPSSALPGGFTGFANPSGLIGMTATNGVATTADRSDSTHAIDPAIAPTWTGVHLWTNLLKASGSPLAAGITQVQTGLAAYKPSDTTAANNTLTADAALTLTFNEVGKYKFEIWLPFFEATLGTGGFQFDLGSGSATLANLVYGVDGFSTASVINAGVTSATTATAASSVATSSSAPSWFLAKGSLSITGAGTLAIRWSQASTLGADPTTLMTGAYFTATKVA